MNAVAMNNILTFLQGLSMTASNKRWLAEHLIEAPTTKKNTARQPSFPKLPKDYKPSDEVMAMTLGPLPKDVNLEQEIKER